MNRRHVNPKPSATRKEATAPYNFVPLPEKVLFVSDGFLLGDERVKPWASHDQWDDRLLNGTIDLRIETLTPLFIRGLDDGGAATESRLRPQPFTVPRGDKNVPAIPGSSLRGMIRNLYEIITFSKLQPVPDRKLWFRSVGTDNLGAAYATRRGEVRLGVLEQSGQAWLIRPGRQVAIDGILVGGKTPGSHCVHVRAGIDAVTTEKSDDMVDGPVGAARGQIEEGFEAAELLITGPMKGKQKAYAVVPDAGSSTLSIPAALWNDFCSDEQITQDQKDWYPANGIPKAGAAVWYTPTSNGKVVAGFGRTQLFRLPYDRTPAHVLSGYADRREPLQGEHHDGGIDMAEALFGRVRDKDKSTDAALASRLAFSEAVVDVTAGAYRERDWLHSTIVPRILLSPKPTAFQLYLTQDGAAGNSGRENKEALTTYFRFDQTTLRGHKLYWHQWDHGSDVKQVVRGCPCETPDKSGHRKTHPTEPLRDDEKVHTVMRPVREGKVLSGNITFENLLPEELGALLATIDLPQSQAHKLGMGKALGLGSIRIVPTVKFEPARKSRYSVWSETIPARQVNPQIEAQAREAFRSTLATHLSRRQEVKDPGDIAWNGKRLEGVARLDTLYHLLEWDARPPGSSVRTMPLSEGGFKERLILPSPHWVRIGAPAEPHWQGTAPVRGKFGSGPRDEQAVDALIEESVIWEVATASYSRGGAGQLMVMRGNQRSTLEGDPARAMFADWPERGRGLLMAGRAVPVLAQLTGRHPPARPTQIRFVIEWVTPR